MNISKLLIAATSVACLTALGSAVAQVQFGPITGDAGKGEQLYYDQACYGCHGYQGIGRRNLANDVSGIMFSEEVFITYLRARAELNPRFPTQDMPNYAEESLSDEEAKDIYAYIRTFKDEPPAVDDIPVLKSILDTARSASE